MSYVAEISGIAGSSLYRWISGASAPPLQQLLAIAQACKVNVTDFLYDDNEIPPPGSQRAYPDIEPSDFTFIPRLDVEASAGNGRLASQHEPPQMLGFRTDWLRRLGITPNRAQALTAVGDSMEPTIRDGDLLLVDRSVTQIIDNGIYVLTLGGLVIVKRVQMRRDHSLLLISDNRERYEPETVPPGEVDTLTVEGRVRWFGRSL
ncbi:MAG: helix-turn-helix transcriptional regulator [Hyphomicrobiales bacterium]|nr:helix-turn-helix transcriptional regulator [Hyphomicrobiales bacterium]MDE2113863.1 helix-turn-helix transcriptional regulator [Hyphomicrobiales bacterium]